MPDHVPDFDAVADFYDPLSRLVFGNTIKNAQTCLLQHIPKTATVLIAGGGTGELLTELLQQHQPVNVVYLEASAKMLHLTKEKLQRLTPAQREQVQLIHGTEASLPNTPDFDVIITPFLLDLFPEEQLQPMMQTLHQNLKPGGKWLVADFQLQPESPRWQKVLVKSMYLF
ncbi:MAG: class I SAM-dependent methyltransferase, partial [Hymenobacteraceae bacterium]|nr:class I SAM-dependent methyltransferase [Hymenobacteraceae bacterium]MDX5397132.1 class I SAM-dependent methyltransferase [Hymenobacteraceae bacterium]MDX5513210.1 class I SAM-dependent methyltransferase [Hymenobacteraceae bacterium]